MADDRDHGIGKFDLGQDFRAYRRVGFHALELCRRESTGLVQDVLGHGQLSDVVQQRRGFDGAELGPVFETEPRRQFDRPALDTADVAVGHGILGVDRVRESFDRREVQTIDLGQMVQLIG